MTPHQLLDEIVSKDRLNYEKNIEGILEIKNLFCQIEISDLPSSPNPCWGNKWFSGIDAAVLYYLISKTKPARYYEIGSGNSTKFARKAINDNNLNTEIVCIDPNPRAEISEVADRIYRESIENIDLGIFSSLADGDILFFDGSHRCFMGSDVTVFFLEVLPYIPKRTLVHIHDIHLPFDYPKHRAEHYESEQYLLAVMLLAGQNLFEIIMPNRYVIEDQYFSNLLEQLWSCPQGEITWRRGLWRRGSSFWFKLK